MSKMPSVSELIRRFEAKHGYEPTAEELTDAWFSGELDTLSDEEEDAIIKLAELEGMR